MQAGQTQVASDRVWRVARLVIPVTAVVAAAVCGVVLYSHHHSLAKGGEDKPSYSTAVIIIGTCTQYSTAVTTSYTINTDLLCSTAVIIIGTNTP